MEADLRAAADGGPEDMRRTGLMRDIIHFSSFASVQSDTIGVFQTDMAQMVVYLAVLVLSSHNYTTKQCTGRQLLVPCFTKLCLLVVKKNS